MARRSTFLSFATGSGRGPTAAIASTRSTGLRWPAVSLPAMAIRGSYTRVLGGSDIDLETYGVDLSISKRVFFMTPYAGVGEVWIRSSTDSRALTTQFKETQNLSKAFVGVKFHLLLLSLVAEADFSTISAYSLRANFSF